MCGRACDGRLLMLDRTRAGPGGRQEVLLLVCLTCAAAIFAVPSGSRYEAFNAALLDYLDAHPERLEG